MDEKQPSKIATVLLRILMPINTVLIVLTLLLSLFVIIDYLLPSTGIILNFSNYGHSMNPTIRGNALVVIDTRTPYESLKVGDVIMFKEPKGLNTATAQIHVHIEKADGDSTSDPSDPSDPGSSASDSSDPSASSEGLYDLENIEYLENCAVLHRIVEIKNTESSEAGQPGQPGQSDQTGQTLLITQGDNNPYQDRYPVTEEAYLGKMIWHIDYIGDIITVLYEKYLVIVIATVVVTAATIALRKKYNHPVWL